jgi:hypothetical protein
MTNIKVGELFAQWEGKSKKISANYSGTFTHMIVKPCLIHSAGLFDTHIKK